MLFPVIVATLILTPAQAHNPVAGIPIHQDYGGLIYVYLAKANLAFFKKKRYVIDGNCYSACTILASVLIKHNLVCTTKNGWLLFHEAWDYSSGKILHGTVQRYYPGDVWDRIEQLGGVARLAPGEWLIMRASDIMPRCNPLSL